MTGFYDQYDPSTSRSERRNKFVDSVHQLSSENSYDSDALIEELEEQPDMASPMTDQAQLDAEYRVKLALDEAKEVKARALKATEVANNARRAQAGETVNLGGEAGNGECSANSEGKLRLFPAASQHQTRGYRDPPRSPQPPSTDEILRKKRQEAAENEYGVAIRRIVLGSTLATFGPGFEIQSIICGFENGLIELRDIPDNATLDEITALFTGINARSCILDIRQYDSSSILATVAVREDVKQRAADAITGKTIRSKAVTAKALKTTIGHSALRHILNISWNTVTKSVPQDFYDSLKQRLMSLHGIVFFEVSSGITYSANGNAVAWFTSATYAEQAQKSLNGQRLSPDFISISCNLAPHKPLNHALIVPMEQYHLHEIGNDILNYGAVSLTSEAEGLTTRVKNLGYDWFDGWQWFLNTSARSSLASELQQQVPCLTPVIWDCMTRTLTIYTDSEANMGRASDLLESFANRSERAMFFERIDRSVAKSLLQSEWLEALRKELGGGNVSLDAVRSQLVISYRGGQSFLSIRQIMEDIESGHRAHDNEASKTCPVCISEVLTPVALLCGHEYCAPCLARHILSSPEQNRLPISCIGNGDACKRPIAIPIIQSLLTPPQFQRLVDNVAQKYFNKHPDQYHNCITPGCTQVYRCSKGIKYITCSSCDVPLCSACHSQAHCYLSCADWKVLSSPTEQERLFSQWLSNDNIKQCPKCKVWIQKVDGCNRVHCRACGTHICWTCLVSSKDSAKDGGISKINNSSKDLDLTQRLQAQDIKDAGLDASASSGSCIVM